MGNGNAAELTTTFQNAAIWSMKPLNLTQINEILNNCTIINQLNIPKSIISIIAGLAVHRPLKFIEGAKRLEIEETDSNLGNKVTVRAVKDKESWYGYHMAITDGEYEFGIHTFKVLIGPTPSSGCRYIGYVSKSNNGIIRMEEGMHACDYWVGWDGSCQSIYTDYSGKRDWDKAIHHKCTDWKQGDEILCQLDCDKGTLTFYKNGTKIDVIVDGMKGRKWIPAVSLLNTHESITILWSLHIDIN